MTPKLEPDFTGVDILKAIAWLRRIRVALLNSFDAEETKALELDTRGDEAWVAFHEANDDALAIIKELSGVAAFWGL